MLGQHHVSLSVLTALILLIPYMHSHTSLSAIILFGVAIGSLVPDADSSDAAIFHRKVKGGSKGYIQAINSLVAPIFPVFGYATRYLIYRPLIFILPRTLLKDYKIEEKHRGFLHSFIGIFMATILTAIYISIILAAVHLLDLIHLIAFFIAYIFGALLHLIEDGATVSGVTFNYPFSNITMRGTIRTRLDSVRKPNLFAEYLMGLFVVVFFITELDLVSISDWVITILSALFLIFSWIVFLFLIAKAKITRT